MVAWLAQAEQALRAAEKENAGSEYRIKILLRSLKEQEERSAQLEARLRTQS